MCQSGVLEAIGKAPLPCVRVVNLFGRSVLGCKAPDIKTRPSGSSVTVPSPAKEGPYAPHPCVRIVEFRTGEATFVQSPWPEPTIRKQRQRASPRRLR